MSHVGDGSDDLRGLEGLDDVTRFAVTSARLEAREIIDRLEPRHISGWPSLIQTLEESLERAKRNSKGFRL